MSRSSTSNSDARPHRVPGPRRWLAWAACTALLLALAEVALHYPPVRDFLPPRSHFSDPGITLRLEALERAVTEHGRIDVLFVGSSIVRTNIQPLLIDRLISDREGTSVVSFNTGLAGVWPEGIAMYVEHVWLPAARPKLVVQGIRYMELSATTPGLRPEQLLAGAVESGWTDDAPWVSRVRSATASRIRLLQYPGAWIGWLQQYQDGRPGDVPRGVPIDSRGYAAARTRANIENDPVNTICGATGCSLGLAALKRTITAVHRRGAKYVLANMPEHAQRWRDPAKYREYANEQGVTFLDVSEGDPRQFASDAEYLDTCHMSPSGSARFSSMLAVTLAPTVRQIADMIAEGSGN
jgi:hypothetical protein